MNYVIVYRDGTLSDARTWERTLFFLDVGEGVPWSHQPVWVLRAPDGWPVEARCTARTDA